MLEELRKHREMVQGRIQKSFESDGLDLNILKAEETEIFKAQETEEQEVSVTDLIKAGVLEYDDSIEKAVYADTAENRKLGRVGQEYHRGNGKKEEESNDFKKLEHSTAKKLAYHFDKVIKEGGNKHTDTILSEVSKQFGSELEKKYGYDNIDDILMDDPDAMNEGDIKKYVSRLSGDNLKRAVESWNKFYGGNTNRTNGKEFKTL